LTALESGAWMGFHAPLLNWRIPLCGTKPGQINSASVVLIFWEKPFYIRKKGNKTLFLDADTTTKISIFTQNKGNLTQKVLSLKQSKAAPGVKRV